MGVPLYRRKQAPFISLCVNGIEARGRPTEARDAKDVVIVT
jgi:hypothetical protein